MNFLVMPLMFISGMMLSIRNMPVWMQELARFNPVHWAVTGAQAAYMGSWSGAALASLSALLLFTVVMVGAMHLTFVRFLARR
ncbi:ABC transporter permease [Massilia sp. H-1]|nr:ABC transporter permease [Massilia sp. H-1]